MSPLRRWMLCLAAAALLFSLAGCETPTHILRQRGEVSFNNQRYETAEDYMLRVHDREPQDWKANYYLGRLALIDGNADRARTFLEVAYNLRAEGPPLQPETFDIIDALAEALYLQGDEPRLLGFLDEAIGNFGRPADYLRKANYLRQMGDPDAALVVYRTAMRVSDGRDPAVYIAMADFYDALDDRATATVFLRRAYGLSPDDPAISERLRSHGVVPGPTVALPPLDPTP